MIVINLSKVNVLVIVRIECSVVCRGGSRTALTGAVTMEQAGSAVGAGSARPSSPVVILLSQRVGKPHPYKTCHFGSPFSTLEYPFIYVTDQGISINLWVCKLSCHSGCCKMYFTISAVFLHEQGCM